MATQDSTRRGLFDWVASREPRFLPFFDLVQREASRRGKVFFLQSGIGNDFSTPEMEGEDLVGWLVNSSDADEFESQWREDVHGVDDRFQSNFALVEWQKTDSGIKVTIDDS